MTTLARNVPAPAGLGVVMARVPEGAPIDLDLRLESVLEGVLVSGTADVPVSADCSRCLEPVDWHQEFDLTELLRAFELVEGRDIEAYGKLRRSSEGRAVPLPGIFSGTDADVALLALGFARGEPSALAVPYARRAEV